MYFNTDVQPNIFFQRGKKKKKTIKGVYTVTEARKLTEQGELDRKSVV